MAIIGRGIINLSISSPMSDLLVKSFHIKDSSDEQAFNEFLAGKIVRHWSANYTPVPSSDGGTWNVFVAYEIRQHNTQPTGRDTQRHGQESRGRKGAISKPVSTHSVAPRQEKSAPEEYKPDVAEKDFPLFEAVRKWRNSRAREERVKPFAFFNNKQLEQIVTSKPADTEALRSIVSDMSANLWEKYQNELLAFIET